MLKENKRTLIITSIVIILPILIGVYFWDRLPDSMATHFGLNNDADGFSSKAFTVFGIPLVMLAIHWVMILVVAHDPRKQNIGKKLFKFVLWISPVVTLFALSMIYAYNLGYPLNISFFGELWICMILIIIGNYLPKARQNYTIGIRLPWTIANEENWNRTHRFAGYLWMITGIIMLIVVLTGLIQPVWVLVILLAVIFIPFIYSFWLHAARDL